MQPLRNALLLLPVQVEPFLRRALTRNCVLGGGVSDAAGEHEREGSCICAAAKFLDLRTIVVFSSQIRMRRCVEAHVVILHSPHAWAGSSGLVRTLSHSAFAALTAIKPERLLDHTNPAVPAEAPAGGVFHGTALSAAANALRGTEWSRVGPTEWSRVGRTAHRRSGAATVNPPYGGPPAGIVPAWAWPLARCTIAAISRRWFATSVAATRPR